MPGRTPGGGSLAVAVLCNATTDAEIIEVGLTSDEGSSRAPLAAPTDVKVRQLKKSNAVLVTAVQAGTVRPRAAEIRTDATEPRNYRILPGSRASLKLTDLEPGLYWVRFATVLNNQKSDWSGAVPVRVRAKCADREEHRTRFACGLPGSALPSQEAGREWPIW